VPSPRGAASETTATAPFLRAAPTKSLPSVASPRIATNSAPGARAARVVRHRGDLEGGSPVISLCGSRATISESLTSAAPAERQQARQSRLDLGARLGALRDHLAEPRSSTTRPRRAAAIAASRAGRPRRSGISPGSSGRRELRAAAGPAAGRPRA
jgi:hypothetical protein